MRAWSWSGSARTPTPASGWSSCSRAGDLPRCARSPPRDARPRADPRAPLRLLTEFLDWLDEQPAERERYLEAAQRMRERVVFTGRLEHSEVAEVLPLCDAMVVPSTFPEAFGMVAAEAAACGALPVSAAHSGLAEVSAALAAGVARAGAPAAVVPARRAGRAVDRAAAERLDAGARELRELDSGVARRDRHRAVVVGGRRPPRDRRRAGRHRARAVARLAQPAALTAPRPHGTLRR